jgi:hypothetical protein
MSISYWPGCGHLFQCHSIVKYIVCSGGSDSPNIADSVKNNGRMVEDALSKTANETPKTSLAICLAVLIPFPD